MASLSLAVDVRSYTRRHSVEFRYSIFVGARLFYILARYLALSFATLPLSLLVNQVWPSTLGEFLN